MATMITHPMIPLVLGCSLGQSIISVRLLIVACIASILPDFDVIVFKFGIPYASDYGHRGFTHSITFAVMVGMIGVWFHRTLNCNRWVGFSLLFIATVSHGILDALTNGGLGIAFFWPLDSSRYFFPWQPLEVSPLGIRRFLNGRGLEVIRSELLWVWLPSFALSMLMYTLRCRFQRSSTIRGNPNAKWQGLRLAGSAHQVIRRIRETG